MLLLPSGLKLAISRDALFDHGGNWFKCTEGHFWYWTPDEQIMGDGPYPPDSEILCSAVHVPVPTTTAEAQKYIYVLECEDGRNWGWRGEWLDKFPRYRRLATEDKAAWANWIASDEVQEYLQETITECQKLADLGRMARGMARFSSS